MRLEPKLLVFVDKFSLIERELVAHLYAGLLTDLNRLEHLEASLACGQLNLKGIGFLALTDDVEVFQAERERGRQIILATILKVEAGALGRVVELVESLLLLTKVVDVFLFFSELVDLFVREHAWMRQVLQTICAAALNTAQDNDMVLTCRHLKLHIEAFFAGWSRHYDLKAL